MLHAATTIDNAIWTFNNIARRYSVSTGEGTNGLNFATANDPRVPVCLGGDAACKANGVTIKPARRQSAFPIYVQLVWPTRDVVGDDRRRGRGANDRGGGGASGRAT